MSEAKHTPGPWQMSGSRGLSPEYRGHGVGTDGKDYVVVVPYNDKDHAECIANARLISAAPEMLAALIDLDARLRECGALHTAEDAYDSFYQEMVSEAIAKATGAAK